MSDEPNEIISTGDIEEASYDGHGEPSDVRTDMVATVKAERKGIEFHVSMRDYTMDDMQSLIVEAAAFQIIGRFGKDQLVKAIEAKCIELIDNKAKAALEKVTTEIIDQPITPKFGDKKPVTMREFIGLTGREYLAELVGNDGSPNTDHWSSSKQPRLQYLVWQTMTRQFKDEITKATSSVIVALQKETKAALDKFLAGEKLRLTEALTKVTAP